MADILTVIHGISQALANKHDGALDEKGERVKIGLARDEEVDIRDKRIIDGFNCKISGDKLILKYNSEYPLADAHKRDFKDEIEGYLKKAATFLKDEYHRVTGKSLGLSQASEPEIFVEPMSRVRVLAKAVQTFKIGGLGDVESVGNEDDAERKLDKAFKEFLMIGKDRASSEKPKNVKIGKNENAKPAADKIL